MFKRIARLFSGDSRSPFESYYSSLLLHKPGEGAISAREARRDYATLLKWRAKQDLFLRGF